MAIGIPAAMLIGGAASAAGNIGSSILSNSAAVRATEKQVNWNENAAKHAHQWEVQDLEAAGLNPVLSATSGGATTGAVSPVMPDYSGIANAGNNIMSAIMSSYTADKIKSETKNIDADTENKKEQKESIIAERNLTKQQTKKLNWDITKIKSDIKRNEQLNSKDRTEINQMVENIRKIKSEKELIDAEKELTYAKKDLTKQEEQYKLILSQKGLKEIEYKIAENQLIQVRAKMRYVDYTMEKIGQITKNLNEGARTITSAINAITN